MFARMLEFKVKPELKKDFIKTVREEVLPILRKQTGFLDVIAFTSEHNIEKHMMISLWDKKINAEKYEAEKFLKVNEIVRPLLLTPIVVTPFEVDTAVSDKVLSVAA
jgi:quinol monooxygenase YgiN